MAAQGKPWLSVRARLVLEVLLALALLLLDARDLWFKLRWVGPGDAYAFSASETLVLQPKALLPATNRSSLPGRAARQASGWPSFLDKCDSLTPLTAKGSPGGIPGTRVEGDVSHVLGRNCRLGPASSPAVVPELVLVSSLRVDAVAWAACELLSLNRKPPICHSAVAKQFRARYAMHGPPVGLFQDREQAEGGSDGTQRLLERAEAGGEAEMELIELLDVVSKSAPLAGVVCVEGFAHKGPGLYTPSIFGCGSPSHFRSAFVGRFATSFRRLQRDKAWLTADVLHVMDMTLLVRSNAQSEFVAAATAGDPTGSDLVVEHRMRVNVSCAGALYTLMVLADFWLMALSARSSLETARWMLWPVCKSALRSDRWASSGSFVTKLGFTVDDYRDVLRASQLRSAPVALLATLSRLLTWATVLPLAPMAFGGDAADAFTRANVLLTTARLWLLVLLAVNAAWDAFAAFDEQRALRLARGTFVTKLEVAGVALSGGYAVLSRAARRLVRAKHVMERQRVVDSLSFRGKALAANAFPEQLDSLQNSPAEVLAAVFAPLVWAVALSMAALAALATARWFFFRLRSQDAMERHVLSLRTSGASTSLVTPDAESPSKASALPSNGSPSKLSALLGTTDRTNTTAGILMNSSPSKLASLGATAAAPPLLRRASFAFESVDVSQRLPLEEVTDVPMRARSLVRDALFMETNTGQQVTLRPSLYLEFGVVLHGAALRTRCGFLDVVQTQLRAQDHALMEADGGDGRIPDSSSTEKPCCGSDRRDVQLPLR